MSINDGGAAFPQREQVGDVVLDKGGMSLRDYFAAKAMQVLTSGDLADFAQVAKESYAMADAMLSAREAS